MAMLWWSIWPTKSVHWKRRYTHDSASGCRRHRQASLQQPHHACSRLNVVSLTCRCLESPVFSRYKLPNLAGRNEASCVSLTSAKACLCSDVPFRLDFCRLLSVAGIRLRGCAIRKPHLLGMCGAFCTYVDVERSVPRSAT